MPSERFHSWLRWNTVELLSPDLIVFAVGKEVPERPCVAPCIEDLVYPLPLDRFSLARTSNFGIRTAIDQGAKVIVKTDPDIYFAGQLTRLLAVKPGELLSPRMVDVSEPGGYRPDPPRHAGDGTVAMRAEDWQRCQGYDEKFVGYGGEDNEIVFHAESLGIKVDRSGVVEHVSHVARQVRGPAWNPDFNPPNSQANVALAGRLPGSQPDWGRPERTNGPLAASGGNDR
jgi:hypothetical protein